MNHTQTQGPGCHLGTLWENLITLWVQNQDLILSLIQKQIKIPTFLKQVLLCFPGFKASSALFRHEVAFVFGQMQDERSVPYLKKTLENTEEHEMVRHEAAEALGCIATEECTEVLQR